MRRRERGFTLIELLVALVILSLALSFIPSVLVIGRRVWQANEDLADKNATMTVLRFVESRVAEAMPVFNRGPGGDLQLMFEGEPDRLSFLAPATIAAEGGGVYEFELKTVSHPRGGRALHLRRSVRRPGSRVPESASEVRTFDRIRDLRLRYLGRNSAGEAAWETAWKSRNALPELVEIELLPLASGVAAKRVLVELKLRAQ